MSELQTYLGWKVDYTTPPGESALIAPDSVNWQVFKNPVALAIGGICAVLLEFADARIRSGVWDHSVFKTDPIGRSKRTGTAAMVGTYGPASAARRVIQGVNNMHARVNGETPNGEAYRALDPELLDWVSATAGYGFITAYHRFVRKLTEDEFNSYFIASEPVTRLYGVQTPLKSVADFNVMMAQLLPRFEPHPINTEFLDIMRSGRAAPNVPKGLQSALVHAAVDILPAPVRERLGLGAEYNLSPIGHLTVKAMARMAERTPDLNGPAAQASERLGLPRSFLWKSPAERKRLLEDARSRGALQKATA
ncbi:oxygenase MpaB family protein [Hyphomonas sp. WL0036]|uniref:oxygenase MpaB family protein n=1 Tax=Hyphomonas sediminis TaxID=2866160 RepID=UPI001C7E9773|nr:oxygenase MpaB family protein [Hyphomonas sediminis]MBY9065783.1 oxygenase MpaB family protein [Hyphomonas sediminis]